MVPNGDILASVINEGIYRSTDGGSNWTKFSDGLANNNIRSFTFDNTNRLFAATDGGVFYTDEYSKGEKSIVESFDSSAKFPKSFQL